MKTILVTGSNGLLGQKLTEEILKDTTFRLIATSKGRNRYPVKEGYVYIELDITDEAEVVRVVSSVKPDVLINTAAVTQVDICEQDKACCSELNVEAVENLLRVCEPLNVHFIQLSTDFVFDGEGGPYDEHAVPNPLSYYGGTKLQAEKAVQQSVCKWAVVRTVLVYGVVKEMSRSNIVLWVRSALESGKQINVVSDQWRTPTLAEDLAIGCLLIAKKGKAGVYHIAGDEMMSIYEIAERAADFWGLDKSNMKPVVSAMLNEAPRPKRTGFIIEKAIKELGYRPRSFKEGLEIVTAQLKADQL